MSKKKKEAIYDPAESLTEVVAVLRRHIPDDTYRFPPGHDFTGRNIYRASLIRLENIERMYSDELKSGYMDAVINFAKARSLERLRAYDLASKNYREAARKDGKLHDEALHSASVCDSLHEAVQVGIDLPDPTQPGEGLPRDAEQVTAILDVRIADLVAIERSLEESGYEDSHYHPVIQLEIQRADLARARYFVAMRHVIPNGTIRAVSEMQRLITRHAASHDRRAQTLQLANLYAQLAREYVIAVPPESLYFDPPRFQELVDAAVQPFESVAAQDGTPEKLEATRLLEAFLAFTLSIDRDRFAH